MCAALQPETKLLSTEHLTALLAGLGESLSGVELESCVEALLGAELAAGKGLSAIGADVTPTELAQGVLGFAAEDDGEEEEGEGEAYALGEEEEA